MTESTRPDWNTRVSETTRLVDVMAAPEFAGFGHLIFPHLDRITEAMTVADTGALLPFHTCVHPAEVAATLNDLLAGVRHGRVSFHRIYDAEEVADDPAKADVGLFRFAGDPGAPFAVVSPGGGFTYVGSVHEGFPYAQAIIKHGYHAFVLHYRAAGGDGQPAVEDLARGVDHIFAHQAALGVSTEDYSLWGSSAGARMAAGLASHGGAAFGAHDHPRPSAVIMAYTSHNHDTTDEPATFAVIGAHDSIAKPPIMQARIARLQRAGTDTEFHLYDGVGHGFGPGTGTAAEAWIEDAVRFWERHIRH